MKPVELGRKLRRARENCGLRQEEVAVALQIPRTAVVHIEGGKRSVSTLELADLAKLYRCSVSQFFAEEASEEEEDILVALYRVAPGLEHDPGMRDEVLRSIAIYRQGVELERILRRRPRIGPPAYDLDAPTSAMTAIVQGTEVAEEERKRLGLGKAPIADAADLISAQGIWASGAELPEGMSGLFLRHSSIGMAILVNYHHVRGRKRFSYAHEYAHALIDRDRGSAVTISTRENSHELIEKRANAFAAAFLMPKAGVEGMLHLVGKGLPSRHEQPVYSVAEDTGVESKGRPPARSQQITYQDVARLAYHFGASYQAVAYRLQSLQFVTRRECERLLDARRIELGKSYVARLEEIDDSGGPNPDAVRRDDRELVSQVAGLAIEAYRREEISSGKLRDIAAVLRFPAADLLRFAEAARA